jgi:hypothetical protein
MKVRVKENCTGYFGDVRRRAGEVFEMPDANVVPLDDNGKALVDNRGKVRICAWVEPVNPANLDALLKKLGAPARPALPKQVLAKLAPEPELVPETDQERPSDKSPV